MRAILTAIYELYSGNARLVAALPGGLHLEMAPQGTAMTYATYNIITARPEYMLSTPGDEVLRIQFDIYAETSALRLAAYCLLTNLFDDSRPEAVDYTPVIVERIGEQFLREGPQNEIFRAIVEYVGRWDKAAYSILTDNNGVYLIDEDGSFLGGRYGNC